MKKLLFLLPLWFGYASMASTFPAFPAYDPFTNASAGGGTSYAVGATLAGQTNAMGQYWYSIDSGGPAIDSLNISGVSLSYLGLPGFSGNTILLTNAAGPGARMFVATNSSGFFVTGPLSIFYSMVMSVSNINSLSTVGDFCMGISDQGTIANQGNQPGTVAARLYFRKVNGTNYQLGISKQGGTATNYAPALYATNQILFVVIDYEIITTVATSGTRDNVRLWVNPDTSTFGAQTQPTESASVLAQDADLTPSITAVQFYDRATDTPNDLYITGFRMGTNWSWVTGGPAIAQQPVTSTNVPNGTITLGVIAMNNGTTNSYQWAFNGTNLADGSSISGSGATVSGSGTASLTITGMHSPDAGSYTAIVTNIYGAVTSSVSAITTFTAPLITVEPIITNLVLYAGVTNTISLTAVGLAPLSYYWYSNTVLAPTMTGPSFTNNNVQAAGAFYCIVSNSLGTATSSVVSLTVVSAPTYPYPLAVYNDHPISFWPLSEVPDNSAGDDGTNAYDYEGGNNGYYTNAALGQQSYAVGLASEYGYSPATDTNSSAGFAQFATPNSYVAQIPNINFGSNYAPAFSVEAWANAIGDSEVNGAGIVNKGYGSGGEQFTLDYANGWRFYVRNSIDTSVVALSTNKADANWHHLVGVVDTTHSNITIYVDGAARTVTAYNPSVGILNSASPVVIGSRMSGVASTTFDDNFAGDIQNVAIYNYALTAAQVANHYYAAGIGPTVALPSSTNVNEGTTLVVNSAAVGSPVLSYQWYDVTSGSPGTPLTGQTNATLVISNISAAAYNSHSIDVTVTNIYGQATSGSILLTVVAGVPNSVVIAPSAIKVYAGAAVPFTVTAQGSIPYYYQWSTNGTPVPGATNMVYTNITAVAGSYTIGCEVTNHVGPGTPGTASLAVIAAPADYYGATVLKDGPVAFWRLDEPANATIANDYAGGHNATYVNALNGQPGFSPVTIPSETATAFGSNAAPSYAEEINNSTSGIPLIDFSAQGANAEFSLETWVNEVPQGGGLLEKGYPNNTQFAFDGGGTGGAFRFVMHNAADSIYTADSGALLPDGNWHHLVGVCDEAHGTVYMYADGVLRNTGGVPTGSGLLSLSATYPVCIAAQESQNGTSFPGATNAMSQVALYAYAMSSNQVAAHYYAATFVSPTISAVRSGANFVITYTGTLVSGANVRDPITNVVAGATSPYTIPATNTQIYFKARSTP